MRFVICALVFAGFIGCQSNKKDADVETAEDYDYRNALQNYKIGVNYLNNQETMKAIEHLEIAIQFDDNNYRYRHALGLSYSLGGRLEDAITELQKALEINPQSTESHNVLGSIYTDLGRYDQAVTELKKAILDKSYGQPQFPYFNLGLCMQKQDRTDEAIAAYTRAIQLDPKFFRAFIALAEIYKGLGNFDRALYFFQQAEPGFNNDVNVLFEIGYALFRLKQYSKAKSYLAQVSILFPPPVIDDPTQDMLRYIAKVQREARN